MESGLAHEKGLEILSLFVNMKISELPEQANSLVRECKGILVALCHTIYNWISLFFLLYFGLKIEMGTSFNTIYVK